MRLLPPRNQHDYWRIETPPTFHILSGMKVRASTVEGIFYPAAAEALAERVGGLLAGAGPAGTAGVLISPHAAYEYSGSLAAAAFRAAAARPVERVLLLGPVHREASDRLLLPESDAFQTPLGAVPLDLEAIQRLAAGDPGFQLDDIPHLEEHCLEVQLPFLQVLFPRALLVPVLMGRPTARLAEALAGALRRELARDAQGTLVVVSANLTCYRPREQGEREAEALLELIRAGSWRALLEHSERKAISSCGAGCIAAILAVGQERGFRMQVLKRASSLELSDDERRVVHYGAIAFE
jgi:AmmeMemoRadiSam system protein B